MNLQPQHRLRIIVITLTCLTFIPSILDARPLMAAKAVSPLHHTFSKYWFIFHFVEDTWRRL